MGEGIGGWGYVYAVKPDELQIRRVGKPFYILLYAKKFHLLYSPCGADNSQSVERIDNEPLAKVADKGKAIIPQAVGQLGEGTWGLSPTIARPSCGRSCKVMMMYSMRDGALCADCGWNG